MAGLRGVGPWSGPASWRQPEANWPVSGANPKPITWLGPVIGGPYCGPNRGRVIAVMRPVRPVPRGHGPGREARGLWRSEAIFSPQVKNSSGLAFDETDTNIAP